MPLTDSHESGRNRPTAAEEQVLVAAIASRDRAAMRRLYFIYHKRLSRFLIRIVRRPEIVEEIVNDTMFTVWRKAPGFRGDSLVSTWILGIAYRQGLKALRRLHSRAMLDMQPSTSANNDDRVAGERETEQWLDRGLASLPPAQRLVIELAYFMGHSCEEIAAITHCPVNTVKTRMFHARERLRSVLTLLEQKRPAPVRTPSIRKGGA